MFIYRSIRVLAKIESLDSLQKLEEIAFRSSQGSGSDYLPILVRTLRNGDEAKALQRLQVVRLALAKYYARCGVIGVGGRYAGVTY